MKNKTNRRYHRILCFMILGVILLWTSIVLVAFGTWNWWLMALYALTAAILSFSIFEERVLVRGIAVFILLEVAQLILCGLIFAIRGMF